MGSPVPTSWAAPCWCCFPLSVSSPAQAEEVWGAEPQTTYSLTAFWSLQPRERAGVSTQWWGNAWLARSRGSWPEAALFRETNLTGMLWAQEESLALGLGIDGPTSQWGRGSCTSSEKKQVQEKNVEGPGKTAFAVGLHTVLEQRTCQKHTRLVGSLEQT